MYKNKDLQDLWKDILSMNLPIEYDVKFSIEKESLDFYLSTCKTTDYKENSVYMSFELISFTDDLEELYNKIRDPYCELLLIESDIPLSSISYIAYAILHELGHVYAYTLLGMYKTQQLEKEQDNTIRQWIEDSLEEDVIKSRYRYFPLERLADLFALKYLKQIKG